MIDEERVYRPESNQSRWYTTGGLSFQMTAQLFVYIDIFILEKNKMPTTRTFLAMVDFVVGLLLFLPHCRCVINQSTSRPVFIATTTILLSMTVTFTIVLIDVRLGLFHASRRELESNLGYY